VTFDDLARLLGMLPAILDRLDTQNALLGRLAAATAPTQPEPTLLSVRQYAARAGLSACTIRRRISDGTLPHVRVAGSIRIPAASLRPADPADVSRLAREARR
jgi:excisionase family DNA binding protein